MAEHVDKLLTRFITQRGNHELGILTNDAPLIKLDYFPASSREVALLSMMKEDERFMTIDVSEGFTQIEITEPTYALEFPAVVSTHNTELLDQFPTDSKYCGKLEVAASIAHSFGEPEPDALGYNSWLHCDYPVLTSDVINRHWSSACQEAIASKSRRMDNISKPRAVGPTQSKWIGDGLRAPYCGICGGLHIEYHDIPGGHCKCDEADITEVNDGVALMVYTQSEDSSSDDDKLPVYACAICNDAIVLGGGGTL
jgi:hypothetical protein